ncbi:MULTISPECIES: hypothetical protein [unclassified Lysinibacillus]|nr:MULTISPECIES: hypothetical protein [unclassified Lysinibacillus]
MSYPSRKHRAKAVSKKKRNEKLAIFRYVTDFFRLVDTIYRLFRMML